MRRAILSMLCLAGLLSAFVFLAAAQQSVASEHRAGHGGKTTPDPFLAGAPFTLDQILHLAGQDAIPLRRRKDAIQNRGVDFTWSAEIANKLKTAGAPDELVDLIKTKAKPEPLPIPKPIPVGALRVNCAPAECDVSFNGISRGSTADGTIQLTGLGIGSAVVDFTKPGYLSSQSKVNIEDGKTVSISAVLDPNRETLESFGAGLYQKMLQALGGEQAVRQLDTVQAVGSVTIWGHEGTSVRWSLLMRNQPDRALFEAKAGNLIHDVMFTGSEFKASKSVKGQDALELPADFGLIRDHQLAALFARLRNPQYKMSAAHAAPVEGEEYSLHAETGTEKIAIGLDAQFRPQRVRIATETGVGSVSITYSDYTEIEKAWYPSSMQIKPDGRPQGIELHFDKVELHPPFKDGDFKPKPRGLGNLWN
jgi:hypothetical protein